MPDNTDDLAHALALLQTRLPTIRKASKAQYGDYANLTDVSRELLPVLGSLGLSFSAKPTYVLRDDGTREFVLKYRLLHACGQYDEGEYPLPQGGTPQALGSAITYARRYTLCSVTGAVAEADDDGQLAEQQAKKPAARGKPPERAAGNQPANRDGSTSRSQVTDAELAATGQMTGGQIREHNKLERDVKGTGPQGAQRLAATPPDDPFYEQPAVRAPQAAGSAAQAIVMHFGRIGITDRDERIKALRRLAGRGDIQSTNDLTAAEGVQVKRELVRIGNDDAAALLALLDEREAVNA